MERGTAFRSGPPEHRVLRERRTREQMKPRPEEPGCRSVSRRRTPAICEFGMPSYGPKVEVETRGARVLDDNLAVPQPRATRQRLPPVNGERPSIRLDPHFDGRVPARIVTKLSCSP